MIDHSNAISWIRHKVGLHFWSTWMIFGGLVMAATMVRPSLFSVLMMLLLLCWQFLTREVARAEGAAHTVCMKCVFGTLVLMCAVVFFMFKVNWVAL